MITALLIALVSGVMAETNLHAPGSNQEKNEVFWRLLSSQENSSWWVSEEDGGSEVGTTYYYDAVNPTRPDSSLVHDLNTYSCDTYMNRYYYTNTPDYYQRDTLIYEIEYSQYISRWGIRDRYNNNNQLILHAIYVTHNFSVPPRTLDQYSYDNHGNLLEMIRSSSYPSPFGPKQITRYTYRTDNQLLTRYFYNVIGNDINNLSLITTETRIYNPSDQLIVTLIKNGTSNFSKSLFAYEPSGYEILHKYYSSTDSLNWRLYKQIATIYGVSYGEIKQLRKDET
ncbi:MAG: hypothetical protein Q8J62_03970, partial [Candidatus Cloacimonadaceae bacterium]|nr:hypothetical protein [Candidatus Cloacimonadaceae bacterium]